MDKYFGVALIIVCSGIILFGLATLGYNTYISLTKERIEVTTENFNSSKNHMANGE